MDEITPSSALSGITVDGSDNNPLYELIDGIIDDGVLELFSAAPFWRLRQTVFPCVDVQALPDTLGDYSSEGNGGAGIISARYIIRLKVPDDFLRVAEICCDNFLRPITEVFPEQSEQGRRQHNRHLMGKEARPVGVMSHGVWTTTVGQDTTTEQCREIDCYSLSSSVDPSAVKATYIAKPPVISDTDTVITVEDALGGSSVLVPALEWLIAARAFGARGDANRAAICQQNAQNLLV